MGCDVEELVNDIQLNAVIDNFLGARKLSAISGMQKPAEQLLKSSGLLDDPHLLVQLELIIDRVQRSKKKSDKANKAASKAYGR